MKYLIVGGGSMGKRRARCLIAGGVAAEHIRIVDSRADRLEECLSKYNVAGFADLQTGLKWDPQTCLVCIAGERATQVCATALQAGKHVFCEAPMGVDVVETRRLGDLAAKHKVLIAAGAQQPFHPLVCRCREWVKDPRFGRPLIFNLEWGQYLPAWHPYEPFSAFYSPAQLLGVVHLELAQLYFITDDRMTELKSSRQSVSSLNIPGGDVFQLVGGTRNGMTFAMAFDLIQRPPRNVAGFISENGTVEIDFFADQIRRYLVETKSWETERIPDGYLYEQCYIDEIAHLIRCVNGEATWHNPIDQAIDITRVTQAMEINSQIAGSPATDCV